MSRYIHSKLALRTVLNHKSCFLKLLPHPPCLQVPLFSFLTVLFSSSGKLHHHVTATERLTMHRCFSHSPTLCLALRHPQIPPPMTPFFILPISLTSFWCMTPHHHLPLHSHAVFFQTASRWEAALSVYKSIGLAHLWARLQRQHHSSIWLYSMSKGGQ